MAQAIMAFASAVAMTAPFAAHAGALTVAPIRIEVAASQQFCSVNVGNDAAEGVTVQFRGYRWRQHPDGEDALEAAPDFVVNPSIVTIPAGTTRLVRCSLPVPAEGPEDTFRLLVSEIPRDVRSSGTLSTLLQISIPVFRADPDARPSLFWSNAADECLKIVNEGSAHARVAALTIHRTGMHPVSLDQAFYLLAGGSRQIGECEGSANLDRIDVTLADGSLVSLMQKPAIRQ